MQTIAEDSSNAYICKGEQDDKRPMSGNHDIPKKPMRPLTAYHIFFQIEREYIIQSSVGEVADKSIDDGKVYLSDVPRRYENVKLLPDWHARPGKRRKRKHRKQHGKIGFLELSGLISARWARLERIDPETKSFVERIAKQEVEEYRRDVERYKELTKDLIFPEASESASRPAAPKNEAKKRRGKDNSSRTNRHSLAAPLPEVRFSSDEPHNFMPRSYECEKGIKLSRKNGNARHLLPPPPVLVEDQAVQRKRKMFQQQGDQSLSSCVDPVLGASNHICQQCTSPAREMPTQKQGKASAEVDLCDAEIVQLWRAYQN